MTLAEKLINRFLAESVQSLAKKYGGKMGTPKGDDVYLVIFKDKKSADNFSADVEDEDVYSENYVKKTPAGWVVGLGEIY